MNHNTVYFIFANCNLLYQQTAPDIFASAMWIDGANICKNPQKVFKDAARILFAGRFEGRPSL